MHAKTAKMKAEFPSRPSCSQFDHSSGADRVLTMDLHAPQIQGFFDVPVDHLYAAPVLNGHFQKMGYDPKDLVVVSPDEGSNKRAIGHTKRIGGNLAIVDKRRVNALETQQKNIIGGPVEGKVCLMFDDMISTAVPFAALQNSSTTQGPAKFTSPPPTVFFVAMPSNRFATQPIDSVVITNSIPLSPQNHLPTIQVLSVLHCWPKPSDASTTHKSISQMFGTEGS